MILKQVSDKSAFLQLVGILAEKGVDAEKPICAETFETIAVRYGFSEEHLEEARLAINVAIAFAEVDVRIAAISLTRTRAKFEAVCKHSQALQEALDDLNEEDLFLADHAADCQVLAADEEIAHFADSAPLKPVTALSDGEEGFVLLRPDGQSLPLEELSAGLKDLRQAMEISLKVAGKGRRGRTRDASLEGPLMAAYQIYVNLTDKPFTLQWHSDNAPISDAACFCVDIVRAFDTSSPASKIVSMADEVRKKSIKVSNSQEFEKFLAHFSKRSR
ncbi:hypothetical protein [Hasllibacter sp. MH4015]|uniref:hypothetical protein n=1 Tax=Hasllibacter sp. MH4015 TaxID=2854029 RepID=UPI001CD24971|nr:hypothetical protein [Hasllibacter sp. MH4015]